MKIKKSNINFRRIRIQGKKLTYKKVKIKLTIKTKELWTPYLPNQVLKQMEWHTILWDRKTGTIKMSIIRLTCKYDALTKYQTRNKQVYSIVYTKNLISNKCPEKLWKRPVIGECTIYSPMFTMSPYSPIL